MAGMKLLWRRFAWIVRIHRRSDRAPARIVSIAEAVQRALCSTGGERWFQRELPSVQRRHGGGSVATHAAGVRGNERPGIGIYRSVRPGQQYSVPAWTSSESDEPEVHGRLQRR